MKWPISVAPYHCAIIPMIKKNDTTNFEKSNKINFILLTIMLLGFPAYMIFQKYFEPMLI